MASMQSVDPSTGEVLESYETLSDDELESKLALAADRFRSYRRTSIEARARWMNAAADLLESESRAWGELMTREMGKPVGAAVAEAEKCAWVCRHYAEHAEDFLADEPVEAAAERSFIRYQPIGPVLAVMPWNFPFWQPHRP